MGQFRKELREQEAKRAATESVALWMIAHGYATGHGDTVEDMLSELEWQAVERGTRIIKDNP
jgi:hypothetical protein